MKATAANSLIIDLLKNHNILPHVVAEMCKVTPEAVYAVVEENPDLGWGRKDLCRYIVARKQAWSSYWPEESREALEACKKAHDGGAVTMFQKRERDFIIQYAIPQQVQTNPRLAWFTAPAPTY